MPDGRRQTKTHESAKSVSYTYDDNGNVSTILDRNRTEIDRNFDDLGRLTAREITPASGVGGDTDEAFAYDAMNRLTHGSGRRLPMLRFCGMLTRASLAPRARTGKPPASLSRWAGFARRGQMTYDSLSRVLTEVQGGNPLGTTGKIVSYTWDAAGNRTKVDTPSGFDANEIRDALGRQTGIDDASSTTTKMSATSR